MSNLVSLFGIVPEDWNVDKIGDIFTLSQGLQISSTKRIQEKKDNYIPLLKITDLPHRRFSEFVTKIEPQYIASVNDIIYTRTGNVGLVYTDVEGCVHNNCFKVNFDRDLFDKYYVYYYLKSKQVFIYSNQVATGSVQKDLTHPSFKSCIFAYPTLNEQNKIGIIIKNFDDKIELNNQMNQTLEDMATTLFKEWFENFNFPNEQGKPYKDNDGEMKSSELGKIPIDWEVMKISEISENISRRFKLKEHKEVVFVNTGDVLNGEFLHKDYKNPDNLPGQAKKAIKKGDILYSEIRPKNRRFARVDIDVDDYVVSTKFMVIKRNEKIGYNCLYIYLTLDLTIELFNTIAESRSGTFPQITFDSVSNVKMTLPNNGIIMEKFEKTVEPIFEQIKLNKQQNQTLKQQRDTLLPKLMSGEIRV